VIADVYLGFLGLYWIAGVLIMLVISGSSWKVGSVPAVLVHKFTEKFPAAHHRAFYLLPSTTYNTMTDQDILKPTSANRRRTCQLSNEHKSAIVASRAAGLRWSEVASRNHVAISTAYTVFQAYTNTNNINLAPRKGRPKVFTPLQERDVLRYVRAYQK
jgi:hypothetical protein